MNHVYVHMYIYTVNLPFSNQELHVIIGYMLLQMALFK